MAVDGGWLVWTGAIDHHVSCNAPGRNYAVTVRHGGWAIVGKIKNFVNIGGKIESSGSPTWRTDFLTRKTSEPYKLTGKCGALFICNSFEDDSKRDENGNPKKREGAPNEIKGLEKLFDDSLRDEFIRPTIIKDMDEKDLKEELKKFRQMLIEKKCGSFILVISSHGGKYSNSILMNDVKEINLYRDIVYEFSDKRFPEFQGKPKIFLVSACQDFEDTEKPKSPDEDSNVQLVGSGDTIRDVIIVFATAPYQVAYSGTQKGSVFIKSVVDTFTKRADKDTLKEMLDEVCEAVCQKTEGSNNQITQNVCTFDFWFKNFKF
jgi:hypothetical protein